MTTAVGIEVVMKRFVSVVAAVGLFTAACGSSTTSGVETQPPAAASVPATEHVLPDPTSTLAPDETTTVDPRLTAAASLVDARSAVVRIVGTGTFADPAGDVQANVPGSGSGFVVDPSGIAVTNTHVVTGAAVLEAYVDGEETPRNARVLGVSECSDVALTRSRAPASRTSTGREPDRGRMEDPSCRTRTADRS